MIKCREHKRDYVSNCQWCGKGLCKVCIEGQDGAKKYCDEHRDKVN
jgi:hypothetical protein